jgi:LPPG:FO 2-phospho-L-lactate transferase
MEDLRELGEDVWFQLGDRDLATHLWRTEKLRDGFGLAAVTTAMATALGVSATVLPMTEDEVTTYVDTTGYGPIHYEEYLVRYGAEPEVRGVAHRGSDRARPTAGVLDAIMSTDVVVLAPSNPVASLQPILGLPGVRDALRTTPAPVIAISPIVCGRAITDPGEARRATSRAALMRALAMSPSPAGVAALYRDVCDRFVLDVADEDHSSAIDALGIEVALAYTLPHTGAPPESLCEAILGAETTAHSWNPR